MCLDIYWAIFLDGRAFVAQDKGEATSNLDVLVASLHRDTMPALINVPCDDLTRQTQPQPKKKKVLDSGLNLGGREKPGGPPSGPYGVVDNLYPALTEKWAKVKKVRLGLRFMDMLPHGKLNVKPPIMRTLNLLVKDCRCLIGIVTGVCSKQGWDFDHKLSTAP